MSKEIRIGQKVLHEDDLKFSVEYQGEVFRLKYPSPFEKAAIEADIARKLGGMPRTSFSPEHVAMIEAQAYVDYMVVAEESPDWFKSAWTCYDDLCVAELYAGYLRFRGEFSQRIRDGNP